MPSGLPSNSAINFPVDISQVSLRLLILSYFKYANRYYYSETKPNDTTNKYWHYVDDINTIWE